MQIHLIAIGQRMPGWVNQGYEEYARRLPASCALRLVEIPAERRGKGADIARTLAREGERMFAAIPRGARVIALEVDGQAWSTEALSRELDGWLQSGSDVALLVGGPEGLAPACRQAAQQRWSLSPLTLPHPLVRVVLAEQLYRAHTLLSGHPYHRA